VNEHVVSWVSDYLAQDLSPERSREIEKHLDGCEECSADFAWVRELKEQALRDGVRHLAATRIVELASAGDDAAVDSERQHLAACTFCRGEIAWARKDHDTAEAEKRPIGPSRSSRSEQRSRLDSSFLPWLWVAVAAAAILAVVFLIPRGPRVGGLARVKPLDVTLTRGAVEPGSFEESRDLGLEAYRKRDYEAAIDHLSRAAEMRPDDADVWLYAGSAHLLLDRHVRAANNLRRAVEAAPNPMLRREAQWQLANAELAADRLEEARAILESLAHRAGGRRAEAAELLVELPQE
jgi:tetratricopeptide (TPR) repeat protein